MFLNERKEASENVDIWFRESEYASSTIGGVRLKRGMMNRRIGKRIGMFQLFISDVWTESIGCIGRFYLVSRAFL